MGARVYDPYTGTFTQPDPIQGGGANAYGYTDGDPVNETDLGGAAAEDENPSELIGLDDDGILGPAGIARVSGGGVQITPSADGGADWEGYQEEDQLKGDAEEGKPKVTQQAKQSALKAYSKATSTRLGQYAANKVQTYNPADFGKPGARAVLQTIMKHLGL